MEDWGWSSTVKLECLTGTGSKIWWTDIEECVAICYMLKTSSVGNIVRDTKETDWSKKTEECVEQNETSLGRESQKPEICCLIGSLMMCHKWCQHLIPTSPPNLHLYTPSTCPILICLHTISSSIAAPLSILRLADNISSPFAEDPISSPQHLWALAKIYTFCLGGKLKVYLVATEVNNLYTHDNSNGR